MQINWGMDYETLCNMTMLYVEHYKDQNINKTFVIHKLRNDHGKLVEFLEQCEIYNQYHISYNGLAFDGQISQYILKNKEHHKFLDGETIARDIYAHAQEVISVQTMGDWFNPNVLPEWNLSIKQIDVFKLNHFDNPARRSSLKWLQYSMDWHKQCCVTS